ALLEVDDAVAALLGKPQPELFAEPQRAQAGATARARRRDVRRGDLPGGEALPGERAGNAAPHIGGEGLVREMLELAAAALREVAARRLGMVWAGRERAISM